MHGEKILRREKILEDYPDVFADIVNGFLFDGEEVIKPGRTGGYAGSFRLPGRTETARYGA